jgi:hypothetical protein
MPCACHSEGASQPQGLGRNAADLNPAKYCPRNEYPMMMMMSFIVLSETKPSLPLYTCLGSVLGIWLWAGPSCCFCQEQIKVIIIERARLKNPGPNCCHPLLLSAWHPCARLLRRNLVRNHVLQLQRTKSVTAKKHNKGLEDPRFLLPARNQVRHARCRRLTHGSCCPGGAHSLASNSRTALTLATCCACRVQRSSGLRFWLLWVLSPVALRVRVLAPVAPRL